DRADVISAPATELDRRGQRGEQGVVTVRGVQGEDRGQLGGQLVHPSRRGTDQELFGDLAEGEELLLDRRACSWRAARPVWPGRAVVLVDDAGLARCH